MSGSSRARALVIDAQFRHSLAMVRSLGRKGIDVVCASPARRYPARYSHYSAGSHMLSYSGDPAERLGDLFGIIERERIGVLLPAGLAGNEFICRHRDRLEPAVRAPYNDLQSFELLANKERATALAESLGVPHPRSVRLTAVDEVERIRAAMAYPVVFKSAVDQGTVRYARDTDELRRVAVDFWRAEADLIAREIYPIVQEYIDGSGHGYFALAERGEVVAYFMHTRIHEVPPSGGPSAMARSFRDPMLKELGDRFLAATGWTGVAMIEFKRSRRDGTYYFIEANPKFWGSLDLSIAAGVNFPYLAYQTLVGELPVGQAGRYRDDVAFRWLTMDLAYALRTRGLGRYVRAFRDRHVVDDFSRDDWKPLVALLLTGVGRTMKRR